MTVFCARLLGALKKVSSIIISQYIDRYSRIYPNVATKGFTHDPQTPELTALQQKNSKISH